MKFQARDIAINLANWRTMARVRFCDAGSGCEHKATLSDVVTFVEDLGADNKRLRGELKKLKQLVKRPLIPKAKKR